MNTPVKETQTLDDLTLLVRQEIAKRERNPFYRFWRWFQRWRPLYWMQTRTYRRYHIVNCGRRDNPTGYRGGWSDVDHLMLYASFELLRRFVENENGLTTLASQGMAFRKEAEKYVEMRESYLEEAKQRDQVYTEVKLLYDWWFGLRQQEHDAYSNDATHLSRLYAKDTEMLCRLARVREWLWT